MKYKHSIICCARWESNYIGEWLSYHKHIGVDHIYICCNDNNPSRFLEALEKTPVDKSFYTLMHYTEVGKQFEMYKKALEIARNESEWISFLDIDEFLVLGIFNSVQDFIQSFGQSVDCVYLHWLMFNNSGYETRPYGSILQNYLYREKHLNPHTKYICKTNILTEEKITKINFPLHHALSLDIWNNIKVIDVLGDDLSNYVINFKNKSFDWMEKYKEYDVNELPHINHYHLRSFEDLYIRGFRSHSFDFQGQENYMKKLFEQQNKKEYLVKNGYFDASFKDFSIKNNIYYDKSTENRKNRKVCAENKFWRGNFDLDFEKNKLVFIEQGSQANFSYHEEILFVYWDDWPMEVFVKYNDTYVGVECN